MVSGLLVLLHIFWQLHLTELLGLLVVRHIQRFRQCLIHKSSSQSQVHEIQGRLFDHLFSFLSNKRLQVILDGKSLQEYKIIFLKILGSTLFPIHISDLPDDVICLNYYLSWWYHSNQAWLMAKTRVGFWVWIWPSRHCGLGQKLACWFQCWKDSTPFIWLV